MHCIRAEAVESMNMLYSGDHSAPMCMNNKSVRCISRSLCSDNSHYKETTVDAVWKLVLIY